MNVAFRVDASEGIGIGHVMRCLTLANALKDNGARTRFVCRHLPDYLFGKLTHMGHEVVRLVGVDTAPIQSPLEHAAWLGVNASFDSLEAGQSLKDKHWNWLVVDHYAIDQSWQTELRTLASHIMVIDDLADRSHDCDLLLDQTLGRQPSIYNGLVPDHCRVLTGVDYALLRPEFSQWRDYSLKRREHPELKHLLVTMGGMDQHNVTGQVLTALAKSPLPLDCKITVIMGAAAPFLDTVKKQAESISYQAEVCTDVDNMAELMANSDLVIGAAGSTSWERCCLGVPSIMFVLGYNQEAIAKALSQAGACINAGNMLDKSIVKTIIRLISELVYETSRLKWLGDQSSLVTSGCGTQLIVEKLFRFNKV